MKALILAVISILLPTALWAQTPAQVSLSSPVSINDSVQIKTLLIQQIELKEGSANPELMIYASDDVFEMCDLQGQVLNCSVDYVNGYWNGSIRVSFAVQKASSEFFLTDILSVEFDGHL